MGTDRAWDPISGGGERESGGDRLDWPRPPYGTGRCSNHALERARGGAALGAIAETFRECSHRCAFVAQGRGGPVHTPAGHVAHRRLADELGEPCGEGRARHRDLVGERGKGPRAAGFAVDERDRAADLRVPQGPEPARGARAVRSPEKPAELDALGAKAVAGDARDADYLASAFAGADAVYTLTAFDPTLPDYHADQDRRGEAIAWAIRESGVRHVVALSSIGGELASGNGFIASLHRQERRLRALDRVNLMILRPGAFFEGFYAALDTIRHEGVVADSVAPEAKVPMVATADIAAVAAGALRERNWSGVVVRELIGPRELTYTEAAAAIGAAIGQPDLQYVQLPDEELVAILTEAAGFSPDFATLFVEFNQALSEGRLHSLEGRNQNNTTPTEFEEFAAELAHAYAATA